MELSQKILIVDDSETVRFELKEVLTGAGYNVIEASDGLEGVEKAIKNPDISLIVADVNMPKMDGIEMCSNISKKIQINNVPIIMLTTERDQSLKDRAKTLGVKAWIIKPFNKESILSGISKMIPSKKKAA